MIATLLAVLVAVPLACPTGTLPVGLPPPRGNAEWCEGPDRNGVARRQGPFVQWWRNGKKRTEGTFCFVLQCGRWFTWAEDGRELGAIQYEQILGKP